MIKSVLVVLCVLAAVATAVPLLSDSEEIIARKEWEEFKETHSKKYDTDDEEKVRYHIFLKNRQRIADHNALYEKGLESYDMGMNEFGDLEHDEFVGMLHGYKSSNGLVHEKATRIHTISTADDILPESVDWRKEGYVTAVKNQGQCGSCWAFSATGGLEGQLFKKTGNLTSLSEQNLVDCTNTTEYGCEACDGCWSYEAFLYIKNNDGIDTEASYPYTGEDGTCHYNKSNSGGTDTGYVAIESGSEIALMDATAKIGPISVAMDADHLNFDYYKSGIYHSWFCSTTDLDHAVLVVGYGEQDGEDYWLVKNSWGTTWGIKGYFKIGRFRDNQCGIATEATYPLV